MKTFVLSALFLCLSMSVNAQTDDVVMVDAGSINAGMNQNVPTLVAAQPGCGVSELRRTASAEFDAARLSAITKHKVQKRKLSNEEVYRQVTRSTYVFGRYYRCPDCGNMHSMAMATAFALSDDGIMATNYHVIQSIFPQRGDSVQSDSAYFVTDIEGHTYVVTGILAYSRQNDLAVFQVDTRGQRLVPIPVGQTAPTGAHVSIVANPGDLYFEFTEGVVSRNRMDNGRRGTVHRMETTADYGVGASGGPIVDDCGNMVGMVSSTNTIYSNPDRNNHRDPQMVVKVSIPVSCMRQLLGMK